MALKKFYKKVKKSKITIILKATLCWSWDFEMTQFRLQNIFSKLKDLFPSISVVGGRQKAS